MKKIYALRLVLVMVNILGVAPARGLGFSAWRQGFGQPIVCKDHIIFASPRRDRLTCIDLSGKKVWEKKYWNWNAYICGQKDDNSIVIQIDRRVMAIDVPSGKETPMFKTRNSYQRVRWDGQSGLVWSYRLWKHRRFRVLDPKSGAVLWKNGDIRHVIGTSEDTLICLTGKGHFYPEVVYGIDDAAVEAFDSKSGKRIWKTALGEDFNNGWLHAMQFSSYIVVAVDSKVISLRNSDGQIISTIKKKGQDYRIGFHSNVYAKSTDDMLVNLTSKTELINNKEILRNFLHFYSVPNLKKESTVQLPTTDSVLGLMFYGRHIIAEVRGEAGAEFCGEGSWIPTQQRTTVCLDASTVQPVWQKTHFGRSEPVDGKIYFSDFADSKDLRVLTARIGVIDIASGAQAILYKEKTPE